MSQQAQLRLKVRGRRICGDPAGEGFRLCPDIIFASNFVEINVFILGDS
jgi:hypothetical protein